MNRFLVFVCFSLFSSVLLAQTPVTVKTVTASSIYPTDSSSYYPKFAIDKNSDTAWFPERTDKANRGEWIKFEFEKASAVKYIKIINGWTLSDRSWNRNSRLKTATITLSSGTSKTITLKDTKSVQQFELPLEESEWIKLTVGDVYTGRRWNQEVGITQVSFYAGNQEDSARAKQEAKVRKAKLAKEEAAHLKELKVSLSSAYASQKSSEFMDSLTKMMKSEKFSKGKTLISSYAEKSISDSKLKFATSPDDLLTAYNTYQKSIFYSTYKKKVDELLSLAYEQQLSMLETSPSSAKYIALYQSYIAKNNKLLNLSPLVSKALDLDLQAVNGDIATEEVQSMLTKYTSIKMYSLQQDKLHQLLSAAIKSSIANLKDDADLPSLLATFDKFDLTLSNKKTINESIFERAGISYRETFREGKIGERYVPSLSNTHSYNKTRYINGVAINETEFENYTTGGYDESRYGFVSVYQFFNETNTSYLVDVEITATTKNTEYKTKSSWSGDDTRVSVNKKNKLIQRNSYFLKAKEELKDQLVVGEEIPDDFLIRVIKITPVDASWIDNLAIAQEGDDLSLTFNYFKDPKAIYWQPTIAANFARLSYMNLSTKISVGPKFDSDFKSPVKIEFVNENDFPIDVRFSSNFKNGDNNIFLKANSKSTVSMTAFGKREDSLVVTIEMLEPWL
jgi:hypothetical protein